VSKLLTTRNLATPDEPSELEGLRASSNYLTPKLGAMSADSWTAVALVGGNMALNWAVFLALFFGGGPSADRRRRIRPLGADLAEL
jgi:hypothetical protein